MTAFILAVIVNSYNTGQVSAAAARPSRTSWPRHPVPRLWNSLPQRGAPAGGGGLHVPPLGGKLQRAASGRRKTDLSCHVGVSLSNGAATPRWRPPLPWVRGDRWPLSASPQEACLQGNLIAICLEQLSDPHPLLRQWVAICLGRIWQNFDSARWCGVRDSAHEKLCSLLSDPIPEVSRRRRVRAS